MPKGSTSQVGAIGAFTLAAIRRLGQATLFLVQVLRHSGTSLVRPALTVREIYFAGAEPGPVSSMMYTFRNRRGPPWLCSSICPRGYTGIPGSQ